LQHDITALLLGNEDTSAAPDANNGGRGGVGGAGASGSGGEASGGGGGAPPDPQSLCDTPKIGVRLRQVIIHSSTSSNPSRGFFNAKDGKEASMFCTVGSTVPLQGSFSTTVPIEVFNDLKGAPLTTNININSSVYGERFEDIGWFWADSKTYVKATERYTVNLSYLCTSITSIIENSNPDGPGLFDVLLNNALPFLTKNKAPQSVLNGSAGTLNGSGGSMTVPSSGNDKIGVYVTTAASLMGELFKSSGSVADQAAATRMFVGDEFRLDEKAQFAIMATPGGVSWRVHPPSNSPDVDAELVFEAWGCSDNGYLAKCNVGGGALLFLAKNQNIKVLISLFLTDSTLHDHKTVCACSFLLSASSQSSKQIQGGCLQRWRKCWVMH